MKKISALITAIVLCVSVGLVMTFAAESTSGYCAVGEVDGSRAAILLGDGTVKTVNFTGTAPVAGTVNRFTETDGTYTFTGITWPGYTGWRIFDNNDDNGDFFFDGGGNYGYLWENAVGFVKFSDTSWRVYTGKHMIQIADGVGDQAGTAWPSNLEANWNNDLQKMDVVFADCTKTYESGPEPSKLFDSTGAGFTSGDKTVVLEANSTTDKKPEVITKKLCAVGEVNAEKGLAAVMLEDGKVRTVKYTGTAPTSGKVHTYSIKDGVFTFAEYEYYADGVEWRIYDGLADGSADKPDFFVAYDAAGNETRLYCTENCLTFIKFSDTNWAFFNKGNVINIKNRLDPNFDYTYWPSNLMFTWNTEEVVSLKSQIDSVFCDATENKDATQYYTADQSAMAQGDKNLVIDEDNIYSPNTSDAAVPAAIVVISLCAATVVLVGRKRKV